jgi:HPt (histidine-containing phosphotransfer) domain-containing protein
MPGPKDLAEIKSAPATRDAATVARAVHRLKGAVLHFFAPAVFKTAKTLEQAGNAGDVKAAVKVCVEPETEVLRLVAALCQALDKGPAE